VIPLFLTQGFLENNTKPDGAWDFYNGLGGPRQAWFGMWDHIRGNDVTEGDNAAPHPWFDEVMRFYDQYLNGGPPTGDPAVSVQTSDGTWRAEPQWPPADAVGHTSSLRAGSYTDLALNAGSGDAGSGLTGLTVGQGIWTISPPLPYPAHLAGVPSVSLRVNSLLPRANLSVDLYDIDPHNSATLLSRTAYLLPAGLSSIAPEMYGNDWLLATGHRIGVMVSTANAEWWVPIPSLSPVSVLSGRITLPFLSHLRTAQIPGKVPTRLATFKRVAPFTVDAATISESTSPSFVLPPPQASQPAGVRRDRRARRRSARSRPASRR
jgi:predicted acyl esterase